MAGNSAIQEGRRLKWKKRRSLTPKESTLASKLLSVLNKQKYEHLRKKEIKKLTHNENQFWHQLHPESSPVDPSLYFMSSYFFFLSQSFFSSLLRWSTIASFLTELPIAITQSNSVKCSRQAQHPKNDQLECFNKNLYTYCSQRKRT